MRHTKNCKRQKDIQRYLIYKWIKFPNQKIITQWIKKKKKHTAKLFLQQSHIQFKYKNRMKVKEKDYSMQIVSKR